ncbi:MAG TPA: nitroreductase family deazaflavin-dependent oxidoreductase [Thermomicrobiales bacterium]|jgi:deazaflavin-dependent oxidoreductase (nitroreductase family)|nr:nitroreductase family deazaflavin-dependent oxidoreductase [Thermomicrobiales bacterium]
MPRDTPEQARARDLRYRERSGDHVARYQASDGADGYDDNRHGAPTLLLTTTGHRGGRPVTTPLYFAEDEDRYVVIASYAGADTHPKWYLNLAADPSVFVQVRADRFAARARTAGTDERERLWRLLADRYPFYDDYRTETDRDIPVVVLERAED